MSALTFGGHKSKIDKVFTHLYEVSTLNWYSLTTTYPDLKKRNVRGPQGLTFLCYRACSIYP